MRYKLNIKDKLLISMYFVLLFICSYFLFDTLAQIYYGIENYMLVGVQLAMIFDIVTTFIFAYISLSIVSLSLINISNNEILDDTEGGFNYLKYFIRVAAAFFIINVFLASISYYFLFDSIVEEEMDLMGIIIGSLKINYRAATLFATTTVLYLLSKNKLKRTTNNE